MDKRGESLPMEVPKSSPNFGSNSSLPRHRWYRFKEGFSATLVRDFISEHLHKSNSHLFDPFLGSGTTAVEGALLGHSVDGIETNPFMAFISAVKSRDYSQIRDLEGIALRCLTNKEIHLQFKLPNHTTLVERNGLEKWLLNRSVARRFEQIRTGIAIVESQSGRELLLLALVSCIEQVANARKDGKCWRYKRQWREKKYSASDLDQAFADEVLRYAEDVVLCPRLNGKVRVTQGDSRALDPFPNPQANAVYDGLLTSPPYLNSFDYTDIYRPELLMLKVIQNAQELRNLRFTTLRSHVQVSWTESAPLKIPLLQKKIKELNGTELWCSRIPAMVNAYFVDLDRVLALSAMRLRPKSVVGFVVADSAYAGVVVPVHLILSELLERRGFAVSTMSVLRQNPGNGHHQHRSSEPLNEVLVVAHRSKHKSVKC